MACLDLCSGAGGQALGLERAGFDIVGAVERNSNAAKTLTANRPQWTIHNDDVRSTSWRAGYAGIDLVAAGAPCTPFTPAGRRRGREDARDLLHEVIDVVEQLRPRLVMIENVPALMSPRFAKYRSGLFARLEHLGFSTTSYLLTATDFGVAQRRKRWILVGSAEAHTSLLTCQVETTSESECRSVGETLADLMSERGWRGVGRWAQRASGPAPTITGGSELHGGPDLGHDPAWLGRDSAWIHGASPTTHRLNTTPSFTFRD
jgi:DNA (cytosine-5)-methyltransferase 1